MRKIFIFLALIILSVSCFSQVTNKDIEIRKSAPTLKLNGVGGIVNFYSGDVTITHSSNKLTIVGGDVQIPNLIMPGATSGTVTINPPAVAGATVITLPSATGTLITTADTNLMLANYPIKPEVSAEINDTTVARLAAAVRAVDFADTTLAGTPVYAGGYVTHTYLESYVLNNAGLSVSRLPFIVDVTTGAPSSGDSSITHTYWIGRTVDIYRDGALQYENRNDTNSYEGFRLNNTTGEIIVNPVFQANEEIIIDCYPALLRNYLSIESQESTLLDDILAVWEMDDESGNVVDLLGYKNLYGSGAPTPKQVGKLNYSWLYNPATDDYHGVFDTLKLNHRDAFSVSAWVKTSAANSDGNVVGAISGGPPVNGWTLEVHLATVTAEIWDNGVEKAVTSTTDVSDQTWHHLCMTYDGTTLKLYIDGASEGTPIAATIDYDQYAYFRINRSLAAYLDAYIDGVRYWHDDLSAAEVLELYNSENSGIGYPW